MEEELNQLIESINEIRKNMMKLRRQIVDNPTIGRPRKYDMSVPESIRESKRFYYERNKDKIKEKSTKSVARKREWVHNRIYEYLESKNLSDTYGLSKGRLRRNTTATCIVTPDVTHPKSWVPRKVTGDKIILTCKQCKKSIEI